LHPSAPPGLPPPLSASLQPSLPTPPPSSTRLYLPPTLNCLNNEATICQYLDGICCLQSLSAKIFTLNFYH
jgi:hypothetical protein